MGTSNPPTAPEALISQFQVTKLLRQGTNQPLPSPSAIQSNPIQKLTKPPRPSRQAHLPARNNKQRARNPNSRTHSLRNGIPRCHPRLPRRNLARKKPRRQRHLPLVSSLIIKWHQWHQQPKCRPKTKPNLALHSLPHKKILRSTTTHGNRNTGNLHKPCPALHARQARGGAA